jgi:hypothetical protein
MKTLLGAAESEIPKLPEPLFHEYILPLLVSKVDNPDERVDLTVWQDLAGSLNRPIDVIDSSGNVIFRCPALMRTLPTNTHRNPRESLSEIVANAKVREHQFPGMGRTFFANAVEDKIPTQELNVAPLLMLNKIFAYYGLPLIKVAEDKVLDVEAEERSSIFDGGLDEY